MKHRKKKTNLKTLSVCGLSVALATVLSFVKIDMPLGGGVTLLSMLPIAVVSCAYGLKAGTAAAFAYSVLQLLFGLDNVAYASDAPMALAIIFLDYVVPYTVIGLSGIFSSLDRKASAENRESGCTERRIARRRALCACAGSALTLIFRFLCHFVTGWMIWDALWPNELGMTSAVYSLCYNGGYMLPEIVLTAVAAYLVFRSDRIVRMF